jgi:hypothetical protein
VHIKTDQGWKQLQPRNLVPATPNEGRYRGQLPSPQVVAYLRWLETEIIKQRAARLQTHAQAA